MWHEARKQERKIRGMLVDYRRRAERRRDFYEKIKADPTQFMQLHGRAYKIHLDPNVAAAAESSSTMMPWQGQTDNMIDRFDARAHLDYIPTYNSANDSPDRSAEERQCNYERYRVLVQNSFLGISEEKFLRQLHLEEQYGYTADLDSSRKKKGQGAAIGFNYDDADGSNHPQPTYKSEGQKEESDDSDADVDFDLAIDISKIEMSQAHELNKHGQNFGMSGNDFYSFLTNDMEEAENLRAAREEEEERALYSGRRSRRARRAHQEKRLHNRIISPPSYAAKEPDNKILDRRSRSTSKSVSPVNTGEITYITSFGDDDNEIPSVPARPMTYAEKVKAGPSKNQTSKRRSSERRTRYRSRSRDQKRPQSSSSSRSRSRSHRRSRSNSNSRWRYRRRSRSRSRSRSVSYRTSRKKSASSGSSSRSRSRSKLKSTRSSSKSITSSSSSSSTRSRSIKKSPSKKSVSPKLMEVDTEPVINKPLPRYYGRRKSDKSSSELEDLSDDDSGSQKDFNSANKVSERKLTGLVNSKTGAASKQGNSQLKPQERLKRKMQILLNKQYKADKKAQQLRNEKLEQEARERDDQMRELALKLRRRHRELRNYGDSSTSNSGSEFETSLKDDYDARCKSPSSSHGYRSRRSLERRDRELSIERRSRTRKDRESGGKYRDRSRDRSERDYRRRRYSDDDRSSRRYRSRREKSRSTDSDHKRYSKSSDSKSHESSSSRKPLVDY